MSSRGTHPMEALEVLEIAAESALRAAIAGNVVLALRLFRQVRRLPTPVVTARIHTMSTTWSPLWASFTYGMVFFIAGFLSHTVLGFFLTDPTGVSIHELAEALFGASGFVCIGFGLAKIDGRLRLKRSPLLARVGGKGGSRR